MKTRALIILLAAFTWCGLLPAQVPILTGQYDNNRTGANLNEAILTPANVNSSQFGLLFTLPVDANVVAEPLYVPGLTVQGATHNVLYIATLNNSVYAFDADNPSGSPLWKISLGTPIPSGGIVSTPVIDLTMLMIYVVTGTIENNTSVFRLHGINILTGNEPQASSVIQTLVPGNGDNSTRTKCGSSTTIQPCVPFVAGEQRQRPALLEANGTIYIGFGTLSANETLVSYHGWLIAYSASTLQQTGVFLTTPNGNAAPGQPLCSTMLNPCGHGSGIWMSGGGPAADSNGIYLATGNGGWGSGNWGESVVRLNSAAQLQDYFTPSDYVLLNNKDLDLGDAGPILLPNTNLILSAGKTGLAYVLNRTNLGQMVSGDTQVVQSFQASPACGPKAIFNSNCYEIHTPAYWARSAANPVFYVWAWGDLLRAYDLVGNQFVPDPIPTNTLAASGFPGAGLTISANGDSNGIVWAIVPQSSGGSLYAINASNVQQTLWTTVGIAADGTWNSTVFTAPMVNNGKVYVPTSSNQIRVYGLCSQATPCYPSANGNS
jgi:hypothetical protein